MDCGTNKLQIRCHQKWYKAKNRKYGNWIWNY